MLVLQIASGDFFSTYGGGQVYVKRIVDEMARQGLDVRVVSTIADLAQPRPREYVAPCGSVVPIHEVPPRMSDEALAELIQDEIKPDIIHAHSNKAQVCRVGRRLGVPVVVTSHHGGIVCPAGTLLNCRDQICQTTVSHRSCLRCCLRNVRSGLWWHPLMSLLPRRAYIALGNRLRRLPFIPFITPIGMTAAAIEGKQCEWHEIAEKCNLMIAPSEAMLTAMVRNGLDESKAVVVPHGIPLPAYVPPLPSVNDGVRFFYIGRISYVKGIHTLLAAFHHVGDRQASLYLIGGSATKSERRYERRLKRKYRNDNRIHWLGKLPPERVNDAIRNYHISSSSAFLEAFGLNIAESLAMGKPVLATRCGGAEMQIRDGVNGWLVPSNNPEVMRQKMEEIISKATVLSSMRPAKGVISIESHCKRLTEIYQATL